MADPRFFVDTDLVAGRATDLPARVAHHALHVLRLRDGDGVVLFNGRGGEFHGRLAARGTQVEIALHDPVERESPLDITLLQAWIATDKLDWVVEKAVELGAARIALAPTRRGVVQLHGARLDRRVERLRETAIAACCQCGRNRIPGIVAFDGFGTALTSCLGPARTGVVLQPDGPQSLVDVAGSGSRSVVVAVGAEGGFEAGELALAQRAGYRPVRLGTRVLRTETAGLAALAALQATAGDFR